MDWRRKLAALRHTEMNLHSLVVKKFSGRTRYQDVQDEHPDFWPYWVQIVKEQNPMSQTFTGAVVLLCDVHRFSCASYRFLVWTSRAKHACRILGSWPPKNLPESEY